MDERSEKPAAVYVTSPDYLGNCLDIAGLAAVCRLYGVPLLVDNAHGAYLKFLRPDLHPLSLGADVCCDSAHKTLPVLTGGAYLHIGKNAPPFFSENADRAMALFSSTSPSYLILQSLDACNAELAEGYGNQLADMVQVLDHLKTKLSQFGYTLLGDEPLKLTVAPKSFGCTGDALHGLLRAQGMECEFSDQDFLTMMFTPDTPEHDIARLETVLLSVPRKPTLNLPPPPLPHPEKALSLRNALLSPSREIPVSQAEGRILTDAHLSCPPCVPIIAWGERIDRNAIRCFQYYGIETCTVAAE